MSLTTRPARLEDINILLQFEQGVIEAERPFDPTLKNEQINYYDLHNLINSQESELVIAEWDGVIVGSGYVQIRPADPFLQHTHYGHIGFIYVEPSRRGQGVVGEVIAALTAWANNKNIPEVRLEVYSDNARAIKAYEKIGFKQHMIIMRLDRQSSGI
ncbi:MAG: GNAT family N-acetyltransferase [Chitinophagaceae bacterium]|nr:MAG: GNAT family N-acetyltransferase [Chitinophagaceae bacterium]